VQNCARSAAGATDEEERDLLFEMLEAWTDLVAVEAEVTKQAALERKRLGSVLPAADQSLLLAPFLANQAFDAKAIREMSLALESVCNALGLHVDDEAARIRSPRRSLS
jgi:hypothetical protein